MTKEKRKLSIIMALMIMVFTLMGMNEVYATQVGGQLLQPEEGWKRYDDTDTNISYIDGNTEWIKDLNNLTQYKKTLTYTSENALNNSIKFNFTGDKLRIISYKSDINYRYSNDISLIIDGVKVQTISQLGTKQTHVIAAEVMGLGYKEHTVEMINSTNYSINLDAVDIDKNGELLPYNPNINNNSGIVLDIEPEKERIKIAEEVYADLTIDNIKEIAAEDIRIKYDNEKLQFIDFEEVEGIKLVKSIEDVGNGELRVILASKGEANIVNAKKSLLRLKFKGIKAGEAKVDIVKGRVSDGVEMEKDLTDEQCDEGTIIIEGIKDVNNSGEFTLLDLAIDARHLNKDPNSFPQYNTDIVVNGAIDEDDLLEIGRLMLENPNYIPNI